MLRTGATAPTVPKATVSAQRLAARALMRQASRTTEMTTMGIPDYMIMDDAAREAYGNTMMTGGEMMEKDSSSTSTCIMS